MQVTQTVSEGLKRSFKVIYAANELEKRLEGELSGLKDKVRINGFRPGKVPMGHLRRVYGRAVMADIVQNVINEANQKIVQDNSLKLANEPQIKFSEDKDEVNRVMDAKADFSFEVDLEVLPKFELADMSDIALTREVAPVGEAEVNEAVERLAQQAKSFEPKAEGEAAASGDMVRIDFIGKVDGKPFEGGSGENMAVEIGSNSFIPGFEEQLIGAKVGEERMLNVSFPADYSAAHLAGKPATFDVTVKAIETPGEVKADDELAKKYNFESLDKLKEATKTSLEKDFGEQSRRRLKKNLLDALDAKYSFELPPTLVEQEFASVWGQVEEDLKRSGKTFADENTTEEEAKVEYRRIAERRVRLGLVLAEVGEKASVQVTDDEVTTALIERVRQFPGMEQKLWDYYRNNPQAMASIRAPIYEEKVIDHIITQIKVTDEPVTKEALFAVDDEEKSASSAEKPKKAAKPKAKKKDESAETAE